MRICIVGSAGTWGKEYTKQLLKAKHEIIGVDRNEQSLAEYRRLFPDVKTILSDHEDLDFNGLGIEVLILLSAFKHIDLCEKNPEAAINNNLVGTMQLIKSAVKNKIDILYISTDKAVSPYSVYGMTKALAERLVWHYGGYVTRSGNIADSNGSVADIWREAVKHGKSIKVTDMKMKRYFINVADAVRLSWQGYISGKKLTIVDVGGKIALKDIIKTILAEFGFTIEEYKPAIEIIGLREGIERLEDNITWEFDRKYLSDKDIKRYEKDWE